MKKLLIITNAMNQGGAQTFLMKIYRLLSKSDYIFHFYIMGGGGFYDKEILSLGGKIFYGTMKTKSFFKHKKELRSFFQENKYSYIFRSTSSSIASIDLFYGLKYGKIKNRIHRSAIANNSNSLLHYFFRPVANLFSNVKIAPSHEAGIFMFGKRLVKKNKVHILPNGIDTKKFIFNLDVRERKRNELDIKNEELLFLHIGRFSKQKNHKFLFNIFSKILIQAPNSKLICIGEGELEMENQDLINELGIKEKVFVHKGISDIETFLNAADLMIFPSLFEGLPNVVMEAQGVSLPVIASNTITRDCKVTELVHFLPLEDAKQWANYCIKTAKRYKDNIFLREETQFPEELDIKKIAEKFIKIVFKE